MSIASEITRLQTAKQDIATAIANKGVPTTGHGMDDFATDIAAIPAGGADDRVQKLLVSGGTIDLSDVTGMTFVPLYAFYKYGTSGREYQSIVLPPDVTSIGDNAFYQQNLLASVNLPSGITTISGNAFRGCRSLVLTELPSSLTTLGRSVFYGCTNLNIHTVPSGLATIPQESFYSTGIRDFVIPSTVQTVDSNAVCNCASLQILELCAKSVASYGFQNCYNLQYVWISADCTTLNASAWNYAPFRNCTALTDIYCEATAKPDGWGAYWNYKNQTTQITVHWGVSKADFEQLLP